MSDIKLYYFDIRGRAEIIRLVLSLAGQDFEDIRFSREDWPKFKAESPYGQAPFIEYKGKKYGQSVAIAKFFAREFGLYGKTNLDRLRVDEVSDLVGDLSQELIKIFLEKDDTKKAELRQKAQDEDMPKFCRFFQRLLKENGSNGVFVGKELTLADLQVYGILRNTYVLHGYDVSKDFPELQALIDKVEAHPKIKAFLDKHKDKTM